MSKEDRFTITATRKWDESQKKAKIDFKFEIEGFTTEEVLGVLEIAKSRIIGTGWQEVKEETS